MLLVVVLTIFFGLELALKEGLLAYLSEKAVSKWTISSSFFKLVVKGEQAKAQAFQLLSTGTLNFWQTPPLRPSGR